VLKYIGDGAYIHGVPARDLTDDEEKEHGKLIREQAKVSGAVLYEKVDEKPAKDAPKRDKE